LALHIDWVDLDLLPVKTALPGKEFGIGQMMMMETGQEHFHIGAHSTTGGEK